jgi:predicted phosphatase
MTIAVDFDGTIHDWGNIIKGSKMGPPMEGARAALQEFKLDRHTIVIFTVRGGEESRKHVEEWMKFYDIPYDYVTNVKIPADLYIDDRAIHFTDWAQAMRRVNSNDLEHP